jgi:Cellulose biosynthesis protein BcsS
MTRSASAFWLSALVISASAGAASAADQAIIRKAAVAPERIEYGNLYYGVDWTSHRSLVGYMGVLYAPYGMDKSGLRVSAFGLGGDYRYHGDPGETFKGRFVTADALIGWSHVFNNGAFTLQVGANYQNHRIKPTDPNNSVVGSETGFKVQGDIWVNPTQRTLVYALASYSTAFNTYYSIGRLGYDFVGTGVFFGPEVGGLGNDRTDQFRVGAHLTGIRLGPGKVTVSSGWMRERDEGTGWYAAGSIDFSF